ncbi:MAG TPA: DUF6785 family protein [Planctomycetota bacterium]|nr:DUF6785 family protein [Planctomycetota bacterium]
MNAPPTASAIVGRALTARACLIGGLLGCVLAVLTPLNDWWLGNTPLYNNYNPCVATAIALLLGALNPWLGRRRLASAELAVVVACVLAVGGVVSGGLMRSFTASVAGAGKALATDRLLAPLSVPGPEATRWALPTGMFAALSETGAVDTGDPEYRAVVDRYFTGNDTSGRVDHRTFVSWRDERGEHRALAWRANALTAAPAGALALDGSPLAGLRAGQSAGGATVLAVEPQAVPWDAWIGPALRWLPLLIGALAALLALAGIVQRQWIHHERLPYPLAEVTLSFIAEPHAGRRFAPIFSERGFRLGFVVTLLLLCWKAAADSGWFPVGLTMTIAVWPLFMGEPWMDVHSWWWFFNWSIWFSVIAVAFFLPLDLSFSLWVSWIALNLLHLALTRGGVPMQHQWYDQAGVGGFAAWCAMILWLGRTWYLGALRAAFRRTEDPDLRDAGAYCRALIAASALMVAALMAAGATLAGAALVVLLFLGAFLVLARIFAEAGIPFFGLPGWHISSVVVGLVGALPAAALVPLTLIGMSLLADNREGLMPYATHGNYLAERTGVRRFRLSALLLIVVVAALLLSGATMLWFSYTGSGHPVDAGIGGVMNALRLVADTVAAREGGAAPAAPWASYTVGAALIGAIGVARLAWAWFPLHPIGFLAVFNYASGRLAFSMFLGWAIKAGVMRYGGVGVYRRLKPVAIGMIAGEAMASALFIVVIAVAHWFGWPVAAAPQFMPR